ncbi:MAG: hypothetical protein ACI8W7_003271 [Gammaproteobacteria bacterium]|jgi:hypothetical protein
MNGDCGARRDLRLVRYVCASTCITEEVYLMSRITGDFVAALARVWHRFEPAGQDMDALAEMLAPMDDAGEALSKDVGFDQEPSDYATALHAMAVSKDRP